MNIFVFSKSYLLNIIINWLGQNLIVFSKFWFFNINL